MTALCLRGSSVADVYTDYRSGSLVPRHLPSFLLHIVCNKNLGMRLNSGTLNHAVPVPKYRNSAVIARIGQVSASCPVEETVGTLGQ